MQQAVTPEYKMFHIKLQIPESLAALSGDREVQQTASSTAEKKNLHYYGLSVYLSVYLYIYLSVLLK